MKKVIILGTGGTAIDILDTLNDLNDRAKTKLYSCIGFLDDDKTKHGKEYYKVKVLGPLAQASTLNNVYFINGIGNANNYWKKETIIDKTKIPVDKFLTIIHPTASVSKMAKLGNGVVILQQVTIAANAKVGNHVVILPNSIISHDVVIEDYSCIAGGVSISGRVRVGKACYLGTNAAIISDISIGDYALIGMGSVVLKNVPQNSVMVGNPAKLLKKVTIEEV